MLTGYGFIRVTGGDHLGEQLLLALVVTVWNAVVLALLSGAVAAGILVAKDLVG